MTGSYALGGAFAIVLALGLGLGQARPAAAAEPILPGYWSTTNSARSIVTAPSVKTEKRCISANQIESFLTGFSNHHYKCQNHQLQYGDGTLSMSGVCADRNGLKVTVEGRGQYTPETFHINFEILLAGVPVAHAVSEAKRLSASCPPEPATGGSRKPAEETTSPKAAPRTSQAEPTPAG